MSEWIYTVEENLHFLIRPHKIILCLKFLGVWRSWEFKVEWIIESVVNIIQS